MKKIINQITAIIFLMVFMLIPTFADECKLRTEHPIYKVIDGQVLTEDEQKLIHDSIDYFIENPDMKYVSLYSYDYPSIENFNSQFYNDLISKKIDTITQDYKRPVEINNEIFQYNFCIWASVTKEYKTNTNLEYSQIIIDNYMSDAIRIKNWVDYTYRLVPSLGIYDGMDQVQAIEIINSFVCDYLEYDYTYKYSYLTIYENQLAVCENYSNLFRALCEGAGIKCNAYCSTTHKWNHVVIDNKDYEIDTTWNDSLNDKHAYFLLTREQMQDTHPLVTIED